MLIHPLGVNKAKIFIVKITRKPMDTKILEEIGFTKGEIKVYLALLELGNTTTGPIIIKSKVSRSKVYEILIRLEEKGLVTESIKEDTRYFQTTSPKRIKDYIKSKELALKERGKEFDALLPSLMDKQAQISNKQEVKIFMGYEGQKSFYKDAVDRLGKGDEYLVITMGNEEWENENYHTLIANIHKRRLEKKLHTKVLFNSSKGEFKKREHFPNTPPLFEMRELEMNLPNSIIIFKDTVSITSWGDTIRNFVIICQDVADQYKKFFYEVWDKADSQ
jgi:HTH-type transcriptional regulator, sugar sensing transcriptional regulator